MNDSPWRIELLGRFQLSSIDGSQTESFYDRRQDLLLAYLALEPKTAHLRRVISSVFWPDHDVAAGRNRLAEVLFRLRAQLEEAGIPPDEIVETDKHSISLSGDVATDVQDLESVFGRAELERDPAERQRLVLEAQEILSAGLLPNLTEPWIERARDELFGRLEDLEETTAIPATGSPSGVVPLRDPGQVDDFASAADQLRRARREHALSCAALVEQAEPKLHSPERGAWMKRLAAFESDINQALDWCEANEEWQLAGRIAGATWPFWHMTGKVDRARHLMDTLVQKRYGSQTEIDAKLWHAAGALAMTGGDLELARSRIKEARDLWYGLDNPVGLARSLANLASVEQLDDNYSAARRYYSEAAAILEHDDTHGSYRAMILKNAALVEIEEGALEEAERTLNEAILLCEREGDCVNQAWALCDLSTVAQEREQWEQAGEAADRARALFEREGEVRGIAFALRSVGYVDQKLGNLDKAKSNYRSALALSRELSDWRGAGECYESLAQIARDQGEIERARDLYEKAKPLLERSGSTVADIDAALKELSAP